jgi:hypothetical protein
MIIDAAVERSEQGRFRSKAPAAAAQVVRIPRLSDGKTTCEESLFKVLYNVKRERMAQHLTMKDSSPPVASCPECGRDIHASQSESWCVGCGTPLDDEIARLLPRLVGIRETAARELSEIGPVEPEPRGERIFRGMVGMGTVFGIVAVGLVGALSAISLFKGFDRDDMDFMLAAPFGAFGIAFVLGMFYAGVLAIVARDRPFREVSIARAAFAGCLAGLAPTGFLLLTEAGRSGPEVVNSLMLFPPVSTLLAVATLVIARRAKGKGLVELPGTGLEG